MDDNMKDELDLDEEELDPTKDPALLTDSDDELSDDLEEADPDILNIDDLADAEDEEEEDLYDEEDDM